MKREKTKEVKVGNLVIGGNSPVSVQGMAKVPTSDLKSLLKEKKHEEIVRIKIKADEIHREFINHVDAIHELDREISSIRTKKKKVAKETESKRTLEEANEIYERFKKGEKLSTEDLMTLQKAGLI